MAKDILGRELQVGDFVAYRSSTSCLGRVVSVTPTLRVQAALITDNRKIVFLPRCNFSPVRTAIRVEFDLTGLEIV